MKKRQAIQEIKQKKIIQCPKCKGQPVSAKEVCSACLGHGELSLTKIVKKKTIVESPGWN